MVRYVGIRRLYPVNGANFALQTKDAYVQTVFLEVAQAAASRHDVGDGGQEFRISHLRRRSDSGDYRVDTQNPCRIRRPRHIFCLGKNVEQHPDLYRAIADAGHKVGNHSYSHIKGWGMATGQYVADVDLANQLVESDIFRPPYGRIRRRQAEVLSERYRLVMGGIVSQDYSPSVTPQECLRNVTRYVDGGSIVVFHDSAKAFRNTEYALPRAIEYIAEAGFRFGTIGAAAEPVGPAAKGLHRPDGHRIEAEHPPLVGAGGLSGRY